MIGTVIMVGSEPRMVANCPSPRCGKPMRFMGHAPELVCTDHACMYTSPIGNDAADTVTLHNEMARQFELGRRANNEHKLMIQAPAGQYPMVNITALDTSRDEYELEWYFTHKIGSGG